MEIIKKQIQNAIEIAIYIRDNYCNKIEEKDAIALLCNIAEEI